MATFIDSERSAKKLAFEGHIYLKHTSNTDQTRVYWNCDLKKSHNCAGRAITHGMELGATVEITQIHNHAPSPNRVS
jgi:hypothetical protein